MEEIVEYIVKSLVTEPEKVLINSSEEDRNINISVKVAPEDMGRIIGKQGRIARAMRIIVQTAAVRQGKKCFIEIQE